MGRIKNETLYILDQTVSGNDRIIGSDGDDLKRTKNFSVNDLLGFIQDNSTYVLPTATTVILGGVKIDGTTITIDGNGVISASATVLQSLQDLHDGTDGSNNYADELYVESDDQNSYFSVSITDIGSYFNFNTDADITSSFNVTSGTVSIQGKASAGIFTEGAGGISADVYTDDEGDVRLTGIYAGNIKNQLSFDVDHLRLERNGTTLGVNNRLYVDTPTSATAIHEVIVPARNVSVLTSNYIPLLINEEVANSQGEVSVPFISLPDVDVDYNSNEGKPVVVNSTGDGLELGEEALNLLVHFEQISGVDTDTLGTYSYTISPATTTGVKIISIQVFGYLDFALGNGGMVELSQVDGIEYKWEGLSAHNLDPASNNLVIEVTNASNDLATNTTTMAVHILYLDEASPGGK